MHFDLLYPSRFVKAGDLGGKEVTVAIKKVDLEELETERGMKVKVIITFANGKKQWVVPRTCGEALKLMFGTDTDQWVGKRVTLFSKKVDSFGEEVDAIRVKGSPDIKERLTATIARGRKTIKVDVVPTGAQARKAAPAPAPKSTPATESTPSPEGEADDFTPDEIAAADAAVFT